MLTCSAVPHEHTRTETNRRIGDLAETFGWSHHHTRCPGLTRDGHADGFPAHVLLRGHRLVFVAIAGGRATLIPPERRWVEELAEVTLVEALVVERGELGLLTGALRPDRPRAGPPRAESRAPTAEPASTRNVRPSHRGGRRKQRSQAPTSQEEACEGPRSS